MDNVITHPHTHETAVAAEHHHVALPQHRHHFETEQQQREAASFGMWLFLLTEIMFFGGMFFAYLLYRNWYYPAFVAASNQLNVVEGAINTAITINNDNNYGVFQFSSPTYVVNEATNGFASISTMGVGSEALKV